MGFNHRHCQDNNVMLKVRRRPVRTCEDVDVWLIDFGKSMADVDGEGLFAFTPEKDSRSVVKAYEHKAARPSATEDEDGWKAPWGRGAWLVDQAFWSDETLPFYALFNGWLSHARALDLTWFDTASFAKIRPREKVVTDPELAAMHSFTHAEVKPQRDLLIPYYIVSEEAELYCRFQRT
eukprot:1981786-Prymnesium_polylepis.1